MSTAARLPPASWLRRININILIARCTQLLAIVCFEYGRALAAEQRYQELRRANRATGANVPHCLFAEMYSRPSNERESSS
jgi:hypothetical protein